MLGPMLASASATIISFVDEMKGLSVPSRMYNVLSAGTPIIAIADRNSELALTVEEECAGWVIERGNDESLAGCIEEIASVDGAREAARRGVNGRDAVKARYTFDAVLKQFCDVLR